MNSFRIFMFTLLCFFLGNCQSNRQELNGVDCYPNRANQHFIQNQNGTIAKVAEYYVIKADSSDSKYMTCNLDPQFKKEGLQVVFSLYIKQIFSTEKLPATPALLTQINPK